MRIDSVVIAQHRQAPRFKRPVVTSRMACCIAGHRSIIGVFDEDSLFHLN